MDAPGLGTIALKGRAQASFGCVVDDVVCVLELFFAFARVDPDAVWEDCPLPVKLLVVVVVDPLGAPVPPLVEPADGEARALVADPEDVTVPPLSSWSAFAVAAWAAATSL